MKSTGKKGLVVIVDNLDRVDPRAKTTERSQPEYLFIDRGDQLRQLNCHVVYTIPLALSFSNEREALKNRLGGGRHHRAERGKLYVKELVLNPKS